MKWVGRFVVLVVMVAAIGTRTRPAVAQNHVARVVDRMGVVAHGVKLVFSVPRRVFPNDALIRVEVQVRNISRGDLQIDTTFRGPCISQTKVEVLNDDGQSVYPPALQPFPAPPCAPYIPEILRAGQMVKRTPLVILRGSHLRASVGVSIIANHNPLIYETVPVITPMVDVRLRPAVAPRITLHIRKNLVYVVVQRSAGGHGPLLYQDFGPCPDSTRLDWTRAAGNRIPSGCSYIKHWTIVAGWLNQPVGTLDYHEAGT